MKNIQSKVIIINFSSVFIEISEGCYTLKFWINVSYDWQFYLNFYIVLIALNIKYKLKVESFVSLEFWIENASVTNSFTQNSIHSSPSGEKKMWFHRKNLNLLKKKNLFFNEFSPSIALFPRKSKIFAEKVSHFLLFRVKFGMRNLKRVFFFEWKEFYDRNYWRFANKLPIYLL